MLNCCDLNSVETGIVSSQKISLQLDGKSVVFFEELLGLRSLDVSAAHHSGGGFTEASSAHHSGGGFSETSTAHHSGGGFAEVSTAHHSGGGFLEASRN